MSDHLARARLLIAQNRFAQAESEVMLALAQQPDDGFAHGLLALCLANRERFAEATEHAQTAVACAPDIAWPYTVLCRVHLGRNDVKAAQSAVEQAITLDPLDADNHVLLGRIHFAQAQWQMALDAATTALTTEPENIDAINLKAECYRQLGRRDSAADELGAALRVDPENAETHASLGWLALYNGDRTAAKNHFREALRLDPELDSARQGVLAAIKAWNPVYRLFLKYVFWMQSLGQRNQWMVILGAYVAYRVVLETARGNPSLAPFLWPLLAVYVAMVLLTWLANPLANVALRLHPFGRLALSPDERQGSNWVGGFLLAAIACAPGAWFFDSDTLVRLTIFFAAMLFPVAATTSASRPWPRKPMMLYCLALGACGLVFAIGPLLDGYSHAGHESSALISALARLGATLFFWGWILSFWLGNILASFRWRR